MVNSRKAPTKTKKEKQNNTLIVSSVRSGKVELKKTYQVEEVMRYHSRTKIRPMKSMLINILHKVGVRPSKLVSMFGVSRATIYRHLKKGE